MGLVGGAGIVNDGLVVLVAAVLLEDSRSANCEKTGRQSEVGVGLTEKFMRTTFRPALRKLLIASTELVLGPMVQMMEERR